MAMQEGKNKMFISISGLIGAGKTTLAKRLQTEIPGSTIYFEEVEENPFLSKFYKDPRNFSFKLQLYLLNKRLRQQLSITNDVNMGDAGTVVIQDRSIYEDSMFVNVLSDSEMLDKDEKKLYFDIFNTLSDELMPHPDVLIHLKVTPETAFRRIQKRGRECEKEITLEYLERLHRQYETFVSEVVAKRVPQVIVVEWDEEELPLEDLLNKLLN